MRDEVRGGRASQEEGREEKGEVGGNVFGWPATVPFHSALTHSAVVMSLEKQRVCSVVVNVHF